MVGEEQTSLTQKVLTRQSDDTISTQEHAHASQDSINVPLLAWGKLINIERPVETHMIAKDQFRIGLLVFLLTYALVICCLPRARMLQAVYCTGGGEIPRGDFSAEKIPYFNLVRNFPLIFQGEVRNFPRAEFCPCKQPYHRMPCASPRAPICFFPALLQVLSTNREGGAGSRIICEWRATPSTEVISGTMVIAFSHDL